MDSCRFKYASVLESEEKMYNDVNDFLQRHIIHPRLSHSILLAVSEAFTNALLHGNSSNPKKTIEIAISINAHEITADIIDEGDGDVKSLTTQMADDPWREGGRGVMLMKTLASEVVFRRSTSRNGLHVRMKFDRITYEKTKMI